MLKDQPPLKEGEQLHKQVESAQPEGNGVGVRSFLLQRSLFQGTEQDGEWIWGQIEKNSHYLSRQIWEW